MRIISMVYLEKKTNVVETDECAITGKRKNRSMSREAAKKRWPDLDSDNGRSRC